MAEPTEERSITRSPERIGRYEIVGQLATGGMAEILLGRVPGESGFARAVVVKRILPHLARQAELESMFLDEARIISGIHHPNVVQVFDLGRDGDELYLVMEYLEGESSAGLMRRLLSTNQRLGARLAAHVVSEVCAGLHAAHESTDAQGNPLNVVHRDVSPQNVFVTYDGVVKLLDFGVAKATGRTSKTEAGQVKGKMSYLSPEQCRGKPLDRRSDVFALGILLYELGTAHRLFTRRTDLLTFKAICHDPIPPPHELDPDFPLELERVCLKALSRDRTDRFATALDMRRALLVALRSCDAAEPREEILGNLMHSVFADRIDEKTELLRRVRAGSGVTFIPRAEIDDATELPTAGGETASEVRFATEPSRAPRSRTVLLWLLVVLAGVAASISLLREQAGTPVTEPSPPAADPASSPSAEVPTVPPPTHVVLKVESSPTNAEVQLDGNDGGTTPMELVVPRGSDSVELVLRRDGFVPHSERLVLDRDQRLRVKLEPARRHKPALVAAPKPKPKPRPAPAPSGRGYYQF